MPSLQQIARIFCQSFFVSSAVIVEVLRKFNDIAFTYSVRASQLITHACLFLSASAARSVDRYGQKGR
jgi:hypothetical protein